MEDIRLTKLTECSGCGAKVGAGELARLLQDLPVHRDARLLVGYDKSDDASVYQLTEDTAIVQTVDFFPPIADDPYTFGAIAAANALSDVYAMGGEPLTALNIMMVPEDMPREQVHGILRGGYAKIYEAGAMITGGHSIYDREPKYGMAVTGIVHPKRILTNAGGRPGDILFYTKPLGIGVLTTAGKGGLLSEEQQSRVNELMMTLNKYARDIMVQYPVHACTDVTGFGLLGHLLEMAQGADAEIHICTERLQFLPGALEFAELGLVPAGAYRNRRYAEQATELGALPLALQDLLFDPQTSGGLMIAVAPEAADALEAALRRDARVPKVQRVGELREYRGGKRIFAE